MNEKKSVFGSSIALFSAMVASSCCWLPLLLIAFGAGSATIVVAYIEPYRVPVSIVALIALAFAFYYTYKKPKVDGADCCAVDGRGNIVSVINRINKVMLWVITAFVLAMLFFPETIFSYFAGVSVSPDNSANNKVVSDKVETNNVVTIRVEGMT